MNEWIFKSKMKIVEFHVLHLKPIMRVALTFENEVKKVEATFQSPCWCSPDGFPLYGPSLAC